MREVCVCGDYFDQHKKDGKCRVCGDSYSPGDGCTQFRTATLQSLDGVTDVVLAYRPKIKTKAAKRRARRNKRASKAKDKPKLRELNI